MPASCFGNSCGIACGGRSNAFPQISARQPIPVRLIRLSRVLRSVGFLSRSRDLFTLSYLKGPFVLRCLWLATRVGAIEPAGPPKSSCAEAAWLHEGANTSGLGLRQSAPRVAV